MLSRVTGTPEGGKGVEGKGEEGPKGYARGSSGFR